MVIVLTVVVSETVCNCVHGSFRCEYMYIKGIYEQTQALQQRSVDMFPREFKN